MNGEQPVISARPAHPGRIALGLVVALVVVGPVAGVLATAPMAPTGFERVTDVAYGGGAFHVGVRLPYGMGEQWLRSSDGGRSWSAVLVPPPRATAPEVEPDVWSACADDGFCYRARMAAQPGSKPRTERLVELQPPGSDWRADAELGPGPAIVGMAINPADSSQAVVISWRSGFCRAPSGAWEEIDLTTLASAPSWLTNGILLLGSSRTVLAIGLALSLLGWLVIPTLASKWLAQVFTLLVEAVLWLASSVWGLGHFQGMPMVWANLTWATVTAIVILVGHRRASSDLSPSFDPSKAAR